MRTVKQINCGLEAYGKWSRNISGHIKKADAIWKDRFGKK